jgi:hypothetical protein
LDWSALLVFIAAIAAGWAAFKVPNLALVLGWVHTASEVA